MTPDPPPSSGFAPEGEGFHHRLEDLRRELEQKSAARRTYALNTLLALLWVEDKYRSLAIACVLCGQPPQAGKAETPLWAARFCAHLARPSSRDDLPLPPDVPARVAWAGQAAAAVLTESLDALKAALRTDSPANAEIIRREMEVCRDAPAAAQRLCSAETVAPCLRLLRVVPAETARASGPLARQTTALREAVGQALGAMSADSLTLLWEALGGADDMARRDLMPVLGYLNDPRAVPPLARLLERRHNHADGDVLGWFIVQAFERIGDRRALPALRRVASAGSVRSRLPRLWHGGDTQTSRELALEAERVIRAIETGNTQRERAFLLRPSEAQSATLLRAAADAPYEQDQSDELLRPERAAPENPNEEP